jgi:hypothetical protein
VVSARDSGLVGSGVVVGCVVCLVGCVCTGVGVFVGVGGFGGGPVSRVEGVGGSSSTSSWM